LSTGNYQIDTHTVNVPVAYASDGTTQTTIEEYVAVERWETFYLSDRKANTTQWVAIMKRWDEDGARSFSRSNDFYTFEVAPGYLTNTVQVYQRGGNPAGQLYNYTTSGNGGTGWDSERVFVLYSTQIPGTVPIYRSFKIEYTKGFELFNYSYLTASNFTTSRDTYSEGSFTEFRNCGIVGYAFPVE
jgi:hypothetical protein